MHPRVSLLRGDRIDDRHEPLPHSGAQPAVHPRADLDVGAARLPGRVGIADLGQVSGVAIEEPGSLRLQQRLTTLQPHAVLQKRGGGGARPGDGHHVVPVVHRLHRPQCGSAEPGLLAIQSSYGGGHLLRAHRRPAHVEEVGHGGRQPRQGFSDERGIGERRGVGGVASPPRCEQPREHIRAARRVRRQRLPIRCPRIRLLTVPPVHPEDARPHHRQTHGTERQQ